MTDDKKQKPTGSGNNDGRAEYSEKAHRHPTRDHVIKEDRSRANDVRNSAPPTKKDDND